MDVKFGDIGRAHCVSFTKMPPLPQIIDTSNTPQFKIGKFLANTVNYLTQKQLKCPEAAVHRCS